MVFPHSPPLSVTMNDGEVAAATYCWLLRHRVTPVLQYMPAWFDLHGLEDRFEVSSFSYFYCPVLFPRLSQW
jgi:hypothetical protein